MPLLENQRPKRPERKVSLGEMGRLFLKLGFIGFGGPLAHVALIQQECVEKRGWMANAELLEGLAFSQMLPGPTSTQLAIYSGYRLAGATGALVTGGAFILPAFFLLLILTWAYFRFGAIPVVQGLFYGMTPVVLAMILASNYRLMKSAATERILLLILAASTILVAAVSFNIIALFAIAGTLGILLYGPFRGSGIRNSGFGIRDSESAPESRVPNPDSRPKQLALVPLPVLWHLGWFFIKVGSVIFGGGFVIIPFIEREVVNNLGWLTHREFLDGLALGQMTPGPVVITATFIGYKLDGLVGAMVATAAIFLPSFVFVIVGSAYLIKIERSPYVQAFLKTVNVAALGAILGAVWRLSRASLAHVFPLALLAASLIVMLRYKANFLKVLAAGALLGVLAHWAGL